MKLAVRLNEIDHSLEWGNIRVLEKYSTCINLQKKSEF